MNTCAPRAVRPVLLALGTAAAGWQRAAAVCPAAPGSSSLLLPTAHPDPTSALLSSTMRRSWTCLTVPVTLTHATANPTSKSMRMPVGASTPPVSRHASSTHRTRWVRHGADEEEGWQLGAHQPGMRYVPSKGEVSPGMGQSSPGVMRGEVQLPAGLQQGAVLTPWMGASRFPSSLPRVVVADPVPETGGSFPHHCQHPDECAELPVPRHLHHSPVPDESVRPPAAGETCSCLAAGLFLDPGNVWGSLGEGRAFEVLQREAGLSLSSFQPQPAVVFNGN